MPHIDEFELSQMLSRRLQPLPDDVLRLVAAVRELRHRVDLIAGFAGRQRIASFQRGDREGALAMKWIAEAASGERITE